MTKSHGLIGTRRESSAEQKMRRFSDKLWVKEPRHSENISHKNCHYLFRSVRQYSHSLGLMPLLRSFFVEDVDSGRERRGGGALYRPL